jgi:signal transduction histidine kinase
VNVIKLGLRQKIVMMNLIVLLATFAVVSAVVVERVSVLNTRMLVENLKHQAEISVLSIRQNLLSGESPTGYETEFQTRSRDFARKLFREASVERVLIYSKEKQLLADSDADELSTDSFHELDEVLKGNRTYAIRQNQGVRHLYFSFPVMLDDSILGEIILVQSMSEVDRNTHSIRLLLLVAFFGGSVIILVVSILLSYRITKPILLLKNSAVEIAGGHYTGKIPVYSGDEVGELAASFNVMASEIESRITIIRFEKSKLDAVLESMGEGVVALDSQHQVLAVNNRARSLLSDSTMAEVAGISKKVQITGTKVVEEMNVTGHHILLCATPLLLNNMQAGTVIILSDVTELRLLQEKQRQFVTNVSHELKTPLTTILGYIELLKTKGGSREIFNTAVHHLEDAGERLLRLVNDLIDLSCLNRFEFDIEPKSTNLSDLLREITGQMSLKAKKFNIRISSHIPETRDMLLDPARIKQAVVNLLDNAIKYSPEGEIQVSLEQNMEHSKLVITDSGCGIPSDMLDKVFEPFYRVDKSRARHQGGSGLGLAITREIIAKHSGTIRLESREGQGTKVTVLLPEQKFTGLLHPVDESVKTTG